MVATPRRPERRQSRRSPRRRTTRRTIRWKTVGEVVVLLLKVATALVALYVALGGCGL